MKDEQIIRDTELKDLGVRTKKRQTVILSAKPCKGVQRYRESKRERYLSGEKFDRLGKVLSEAEETGAEDLYTITAIRLLNLTLT